MPRLPVVVTLSALLFACALSLVTAQHRARSAFVDLERAQQQTHQLAADRARMRIDLARATQPSAIEAAARDLGLHPIDGARTVYLPTAAPQVTAGHSAGAEELAARSTGAMP